MVTQTRLKQKAGSLAYKSNLVPAIRRLSTYPVIPVCGDLIITTIGTDDVESAGSNHSTGATVEVASSPDPSASHESYMFGSEADLKAATNISFRLIREIRKARKDAAIVVLNFRALQARRIEEMQE